MKPFGCEKCPFQTDNLGLLIAHARERHGLEGCLYCACVLYLGRR